MLTPLKNYIGENFPSAIDMAYRVRNQAYRATGNLLTHKEYQPFIILARRRTGSNYLRGLLKTHDSIWILGEMFARKEQIGWGCQGHPHSRAVLAQFREDPIQFIESHVFCNVPKYVHALGFKFFYDHAQDEKWLPIWTYLSSMPNLKVIHLKRRNLLRVYLSEQKAILTNRWSSYTEKVAPDAVLTLDYADCLQAFQQIQQQRLEGDHHFRNQAQLEVIYEDIVQNEAQQTARVQEFLGVEAKPLKPVTYRQSYLPLSESIANYHELKAQFRGSEWEMFFEE